MSSFVMSTSNAMYRLEFAGDRHVLVSRVNNTIRTISGYSYEWEERDYLGNIVQSGFNKRKLSFFFNGGFYRLPFSFDTIDSDALQPIVEWCEANVFEEAA